MNSISSAGGTTIVIGSDGKPYGTGITAQHQLTGAGTLPLTTLTPLTGLPNDVRATAVVSGGSNVVVLGSNGKAYSAGANDFNQIESGTTSDRTTLTEVEWLAGTSIKSIDVNDYSIAAVLTDGSIKVAGLNRSGRFQTGGGSTFDPAPLAALPSGELAEQVSIGFHGTAVRTTTGKVYTRGYSSYGELASAATLQEDVWTLDDMGAVTATWIELEDAHLVVLGSNKKVYGSGKNTSGNIGAGPSQYDALVALPNPATGAELVAVATGGTHTLAIGDDGRLYGIGSNNYGELPDHTSGLYSTENFSWVPLASGLAEDVTGITAGYLDTILIDADGVMRGSGHNEGSQAGQITNGDITASEQTSIAMKLLSGQLISNATAPRITGVAQFTKELIATPGEWTPSVKDVRYQWKSDGSEIAGATNKTYLPTPADIGKKITVFVTAQRGRFVSATALSAQTATVTVAPALTFTASKPIIKGTFKSGRTLSISRTTAQLLAGFSPDATSLAYKWYRNGVTISGATSRTYKASSKDKGKRISVRIYGKKSFYGTGSVLTASVRVAS